MPDYRLTRPAKGAIRIIGESTHDQLQQSLMADFGACVRLLALWARFVSRWMEYDRASSRTQPHVCIYRTSVLHNGQHRDTAKRVITTTTAQ